MTTQDEFVAFLDRVGICTWHRAPGLDFPNLAEAMGCDDVMGETWFWKDDLHIERRLFYGKLLAGRPTFVSNGLLPSMVAALGDVDPHTLRDQGRLSAEAVRIYDALAEHRRLSSGDLRRATGLTGRENVTALDHALNALSAMFQVCKVDISGRTRGTYGYVWGLFEDFAPDVLRDAARLRPGHAARAVAERLAEHGVRPTVAQWARLFGWDRETAALACGSADP